MNFFSLALTICFLLTASCASKEVATTPIPTHRGIAQSAELPIYELVKMAKGEDHLIYFMGCQNNVSSCRLLGGRGFHPTEIEKYYRQIKNQAHIKTAGAVSVTVVGGVAATIGVFYIGAGITNITYAYGPQFLKTLMYDNPWSVLPAFTAAITSGVKAGISFFTKLDPRPRYASSRELAKFWNLDVQKDTRIELDFSIETLEKDLAKIDALAMPR